MPRQRTGPRTLTLIGAPGPTLTNQIQISPPATVTAPPTVGTPGPDSDRSGTTADSLPPSEDPPPGVADPGVTDPGVMDPEPRTPVYGDPDFDDPWPSPRRQIAIAVRILCGLIIAILLGHRYLPDVMGVGSLIDTFLPWTFAPLIPALLASLASRSRWAIGIAALACAVWGVDFGPTLAATGSSGPADLRVLSQNVSSQNPDLTGIGHLALARDADIVILQGMSTADGQAADHAAPSAYPHHLSMYEFSIWSRFPLDGSQPVDLATRADLSQTTVSAEGNSGLFGGLLRFTVRVTPTHTATVFAVHLPQPNLSHLGFGIARDNALDALATAIGAESAPNLIVVGDLDLAHTDRGMKDLVNTETGLVSAQAEAGSGFGFTWPAGFPMIRLDDVLTRGLTPVRSTVLGAVGASSAHRPIEADLRF